MKRLGILLSVMLLVFGVSVSAEATLVDMGDGTIYDTDTQLSWLKDANMAVTPMDWAAANAWAASLNAGVGYANLTGWRLPTADPACGLNVNCVNTEMGHLYYTELGNPAWGPLTNSGPFTNLQAGGYWSSTEYSPGSYYAWLFGFYNGAQNVGNKGGTPYAWAVRPGQRSTGPATPVPAAGTAGLIALTLAGLVIYGLRLNMRKA